MKVKVRLYGTLGRRFPGYRPEEGLEVELPDGARVEDLLAHLGLGEDKKPVVTLEGVICGRGHDLMDGAEVNVFQALYGG
jgi:sulfur carrier protein ThiS